MDRVRDEAGARVDTALASAPLLEPPAELVEQWHAALAALPPPVPVRSAPAVDPIAGPGVDGRSGPGRNAQRRAADAARRWGGVRVAAALVGAAAAAGVVFAGPGPRPAPGAEGGPAGDVGVSALHGEPRDTVLDPAAATRCADRLGLDGQVVLAARRIRWRAEPAVRLVLAGDRPGAVRSVTASADCTRRLPAR